LLNLNHKSISRYAAVRMRTDEFSIPAPAASRARSSLPKQDQPGGRSRRSDPTYVPKLSAIMNQAETDGLPTDHRLKHRVQLHSTNLINPKR
jgi:hypothetical protein